MINTSNQRFYSGTSGLVLLTPKSLFPTAFQDKTRLTYYASLFNSIEINSSFYKVPMGVTVGKWAGSVPVHFKFTFKLWKGITHNKGLQFNAEDVDHFMKTIDHAGENKGCLLIQFPASVSIEQLPQLKKLLKCVRKNDPDRQWRIAAEFRNTAWYQRKLYDALANNNCSLVIHDHPSAITPASDIDSELVYTRFHGINGDYRETYDDKALQDHALQIYKWLRSGKTVYTYFNNTIGEAYNNLVALNSFVSGLLIEHP